MNKVLDFFLCVFLLSGSIFLMALTVRIISGVVEKGSC